MRIIDSLARCGVLAVASLTAACTSLIGVDDVSLQSPDARPDPVDCKVSPEFDLVVSNPQTSRLSRRASDGGASLLFLLNTDARPDALSLQLYDNMGGHGVINSVGSYSLTTGDAKFETCGLCVTVFADFDSGASTFGATFMALAQGTLTLTTADATRLAGRMQGLRLRHVDDSSGSTRDVNDGCFVTIDDVHFDMTFAAGAAPAISTRRAAAAR